MLAENPCDTTLLRVLVLTPTRRDAEITSSLLAKAGLPHLVCESIPRLLKEIQVGAGAVLLTERALTEEKFADFLDLMHKQPGWSDLPVIMLVGGGIASVDASGELAPLTNITFIERPAALRSVLSVVHTAVRSRKRQYQIRDQLETIRVAHEERQSLLNSERAARQDAERANRLKDDFLATLSHELRSPLNAFFGWVQIMRMTPDDPATLSEGVTVIERNVRLQTEMIEDLLDMSRIVSGKIRLDLQRIDVAEVISAAIESVNPSFHAKEIELRKTIDPAIGLMDADAGRLQQVLWNLLTNAAKFTPQGGRVSVEAVRERSKLVIRVTDSGEGIPAEFLPQMFNRFSQASGSMNRTHGGLGIGLSIVRNLVEMHGGVIYADSDGAGQGSTFTIELPLPSSHDDMRAIGSSTHAVRKAAHRNRMLHGITVLVVDDDPDARELVRRFLVDCEATAIPAASAAEAQALLESVKPDVIVSDIGMPLLDGYEFMRSVRIQGLKTPAVALTAFARPEDRTRSIQAGYQMHFSKPVESTELIAAIGNLVGRYQ